MSFYPKGVNHKCFINILDVLITIFSFLSEKEWSSGRLVCRAWYSILFTSREEIDGQSISSKVQDKHVIWHPLTPPRNFYKVYFISKRYTNLKKLDLYGCYQITDKSLLYISKLATLQKLCLSWCFNITDKGILHLSSLINLRDLQLSNCKNLTDVSVVSVICKLRNLTSLGISGCTSITDKGN